MILDTEFHISRNGKVIGVHHLNEVLDGINSSKFIATDHYWRDGMTGWVALSQFKNNEIKVPPVTPPNSTSESPQVNWWDPDFHAKRKRDGFLGSAMSKKQFFIFFGFFIMLAPILIIWALEEGRALDRTNKTETTIVVITMLIGLLVGVVMAIYGLLFCNKNDAS
jgi:hypothetical protein